MEEIYKELDRQIKESGSLRKFAERHGYSATFVSKVVNRLAKPSKGLIKKLGFTVTTTITKE